MATSPLDLPPPDDTGSDTLQRYRYQAQLAVPFCLDCATRGNVISILTEHFEDVLIEYQDRWHFIQVKTRNPNLGPWKLSSALDGLQSLWRTHESLLLVGGSNVSYALYLEGAIAKDDLLNELVPKEAQLLTTSSDFHPELIAKMMKRLEIPELGCKQLLSKTTVQPNQPSREDIAARNLRVLSNMAVGASSIEIEIAYKRLVDRILEAMAATSLGSDLPVYIASPNSIDSSKVEKKRLTRDTICTLLGSIAFGPSLLLKRVVETSMSYPTNLEMKLLAAGAEETILKDAKILRANASMRDAELLAASYDDDLFMDVRNRLIVVANSIIQKHRTEAKPFVNGYSELFAILMDRGDYCDPNSTI